MSKQARRFSSRSHRKQNPSIQRWEMRDEAKNEALLAEWEKQLDEEESWNDYSGILLHQEYQNIHDTTFNSRIIIDNQHVILTVWCDAIVEYCDSQDRWFNDVALWNICIRVFDSNSQDKDWKKSSIFCQSTGRSGLKPLIWLNQQLEMVEKMLQGTRSIIFADPDDEKRNSAYRYLLRRGYQQQQWTGGNPYIKECW